MVPASLVFYGACGGDDSAQPGTDASTPDGTNLPDKSKPQQDTYVPPDDTGPPCAPGDVTAFKPKWVPPIVNLNACTDVQISDFFTKCWSSTSTSAACNAWQGLAGNKTCLGCLQTDETANAYGAIVVHMGYGDVNVSGCLAVVLGDTTSSGCAAKDQSITECEQAACQPTCPVTDSATLTTLTNCESAAGKGGCASYVSMACDLSDAGIQDSGMDPSACYGSDFPSYFANVAPILCGGKPAPVLDAGDGGG